MSRISNERLQELISEFFSTMNRQQLLYATPVVDEDANKMPPRRPSTLPARRTGEPRAEYEKRITDAQAGELKRWRKSLRESREKEHRDGDGCQDGFGCRERLMLELHKVYAEYTNILQELAQTRRRTENRLDADTERLGQHRRCFRPAMGRCVVSGQAIENLGDHRAARSGRVPGRRWGFGGDQSFRQPGKAAGGGASFR